MRRAAYSTGTVVIVACGYLGWAIIGSIFFVLDRLLPSQPEGGR